MKPFLVVQLRPETEASDNELEAILHFGKIERTNVHRIRLEQDDLTKVDLDDYSGVIVGGGPFNVSDKEKDSNQQRLEGELRDLMDQIVERDFPYLGICYGFGFLVDYMGGTVSKENYSETTGAVNINFTAEALNDDLCKDLPETFRAFVGHKEACQSPGDKLRVLATSEKCPTQMVKYGKNIYATQFHPELDAHGLEFRINVYMHAGYFDPSDAQDLIDMAHKEKIKIPEEILSRFVKKYRLA